jgi:hypothetical protein
MSKVSPKVTQSSLYFSRLHIAESGGLRPHWLQRIHPASLARSFQSCAAFDAKTKHVRTRKQAATARDSLCLSITEDTTPWRIRTSSKPFTVQSRLLPLMATTDSTIASLQLYLHLHLHLHLHSRCARFRSQISYMAESQNRRVTRTSRSIPTGEMDMSLMVGRAQTFAESSELY